MIDTKELRLGNLIYAEPLHKITTIERISLAGVVVEGSGIPYSDSRISSIPISEEWLERFGFEYDEETKSWTLLTNVGSIDFAFEVQWHFHYPAYSHLSLKSVHHLQNLYFALTGKELELINEKTVK